MALISLSDIEKSFGSREVLRGTSLSLERGDRLGLIGRNGCGKTTLLNIITGREDPDRGWRHVARDLRIAWLDQKPEVDGERTVEEEARTALADLHELEARLTEWHHRIADAPDHQLSAGDRQAFARDEAAFEALAGQKREHALARALHMLGLDGSLLTRPCGQLSGGEVTRLALAKMIASSADVLILDEPTNHLDIPGIEWLQESLLAMEKTLIAVSHDRAFLDAVATKVAEIEDGKVTVIAGDYTQFITVKAERLKSLRRAADLEARFLEKEMDFIRRHMAGQRSREAKGRLTRLQRREAIDVPHEQRAVKVRLKGGTTHADVAASVFDLSMVLGERTLFAGLSFDLLCSEKAGIVGVNGAGKTTLAKVILGELPATSGRVRVAPQLRVGRFTQDLSHLINERTVLEEYARLVNPPNLNVARGPLGAFLFPGDRVEQRVGSLSGGERARLALCILVAKEYDVLVLDEPTNHLDIPSRQALEEALAEYPGLCLIISHDRRFLDRVTTRTLWVDGARTRLYNGSYSDVRDLREDESAAAPESDRAAGGDAPKASATVLPKPRKINEYKLNVIETRMAELAERKELLNARLYDEGVFRDGRKVREVSIELEEIEQELLKLTGEWEAVIEAAGP
jgi:ATP-binding cassette subfamily F protein 3